MKKFFLSMLLSLLIPLVTIAQEAYAVYENSTLTFYYDNLKSSRSGTVYSLNTGYNTPGWYYKKVTKAVFKPSFANARPTSTYRWFTYTGASALTSIVGIEYLNTSEVTNMENMFRDCSGLASLDLSSFDTSNVTDMSCMFFNCSSLTSLNLSSFNTSSITDMASMFLGCKGLKSLDLSSFDTSSVTNVTSMFYGCKGLTSLDLSTFNTSSITNMKQMFYGCSGLSSLNLNGFNTSCVTDMNSMFYGCSGLSSLNLSGFNTSSVTNMNSMFYGCSSLSSLNLNNFNTSCVTDMNSMFYGCSSLSSLSLNSFNTSCVTNLNQMFDGCSGLTSLNLSNFDTKSVTRMYRMFGDCSALNSLDLSSFETSIVTNMNFMFCGCSSLTSLDLSSFDASSVTNMSEMFFGCSSLTSLDLSSFNTSTIKDMSGMFASCSGLTSLDLSKFNTSTVTDMSGMFDGCSGLTSLDLSNFNTSCVSNMAAMFYGCSSLTTIYCGDEWNIGKVTNSFNMFSDCTNLVGGAGTVYSSNHTDKTYAHIDGGLDNPGYLTLKVSPQGGETPSKPEEYAVYNNGTLTFYYDKMKSYRTGTLYDLNVGDSKPGWFSDHSTDITTVVFDTNFADARPTSTYKWFAVGYGKTSALNSIEGIDHLNTSEVTTMSYMFSGCSNLTSLDLNKFDTSSVGDMSYMLSGCSGLTSLDLSNFDTSSVGDMSSMFYGCSGLTSLDLSNFNTTSVTKIDYMFGFCGLTSLDLSSINTSSVVSMNGLFSGCSSLTSLDLSSINTSSVVSMDGLFSGCSSLSSLDLSNFNTNNVTNMSYMFKGCSGLTSLDLSNFNTNNVTNMSYMFEGCSGLTSLDLSCFNTNNVTNTGSMFRDCSNLTSIKIPNSVTSIGNYAFFGCASLTSIEIPNLVTSIGYNAFANCSGLTSVIVKNPIPASILSSTFNNCYNATLYVPEGSKTAYEAADYWKEFSEIIETGVAVTDITKINNVIYIENTQAKKGGEKTLSIKMKNAAAIRGFQFDLYLPQGVTVVKSSNGRIQGALSAGRLPEDDAHNLTFSEQTDGAIRFLCSSQYEETFTGSNGEVATLKVNIDENMTEGDYAVQLKDVKLTETDISKFYATELVQSKLTISTYVVGDISGDDKVDVSDYTGVANYIHGNTPAGFNAKAADVDENDVIDVLDYTGIANIIHTGSIYGTTSTTNSARRSVFMDNDGGGLTLLDNTDVSNIANVIYIEPFQVAAGAETTLSIKMKNTAAIRGFQFDLLLPEGMTAVKSTAGRIQGSLSAGRLPQEDAHDLTFSEQSDGAIRFLCSSQYEETFTGNDGEIATLKVTVSPNMATGDYNIQLKDIKLTENDISKYYETALVNTTVTITEQGENYTVLDENSTSVPEATTEAVDIKVKRTLKAGEWSTICLPFNMTEAQTKAAFGDDVQLKEFTNYEVEYDTNDNVVGLTVNFDDTDLSEGFYGNYPYLIKVANDIDEFTVTSTIEPVEDDCYQEYDNGRTGKNRKVYGTFKGFYHAQTTVPNKCLFLSGNKFWYSTGQTKMKAFRAYFNFVDVLTEAENASARISMSFDDETTRIVNVNVNDDENYYDLQGRRVAHPKKGLYIKNNKKVVVK